MAYYQLFRSGALEVVDSTMLRSQAARDHGLDPLIAAGAFEGMLIPALARFMRLVSELGIEPPLFAMLSLVGVKGYRMALPDRSFDSVSQYQIDRDTLMLPESFVEGLDEDPDKVLQPAFDGLWQSVGFERDRMYQNNGKGHWSLNSERVYEKPDSPYNST